MKPAASPQVQENASAPQATLSLVPRPSASEGASASLQRRVLIYMCVTIFVNHLSLGNIVPVIGLYARSFGVLQWAIGFAVGIAGFSRLLAAVPAGAVADRHGRRNSLALGAAATALGNLLSALAPNYFVFVIGRFVTGFGTGMVQVAGQTILLDLTTPKNRGKTMAIYRSVSTFAMGIGPYPGGLLASRFGLAAPFTGNVILGCLTATLAWFLIPETQGYSGGASKKGPSRPEEGSFLSRMKRLFGLPGFALISFVGFMISSTRQGGFTTLVPIIGHDRLSLSPEQVGFCIALSSFVGLLIGYPAGVLGDRYGQKAVIVPATVLAGVSMMLFVVASSYAWFLAGCVIWTMAISISGLAPVAYTANLAPKGLNAATVSSYHFLADAGYIAGPILMGLAADFAGVNGTLAAAVVLLTAGGLIFAAKAPNAMPAD